MKCKVNKKSTVTIKTNC